MVGNIGMKLLNVNVEHPILPSYNCDCVGGSGTYHTIVSTQYTKFPMKKQNRTPSVQDENDEPTYFTKFILNAAGIRTVVLVYMKRL